MSEAAIWKDFLLSTADSQICSFILFMQSFLFGLKGNTDSPMKKTKKENGLEIHPGHFCRRLVYIHHGINGTGKHGKIIASKEMLLL